MIVTLTGIRHHYRRPVGLVPVLEDITFTMERGDFVAIMGVSGSGKSTLLHILGCLLRPTGGSYRLNGEEVSGLIERQLAGIRSRRIGYVFQLFHLLPELDIVQNVSLPLLYQDELSRTEARSLAVEAIGRVGLQGRHGHRPAELSGGEMQRAAIARALVSSPDLILADEPTGNLDERSSRDILEVFQTMNEAGHSIIMVTHDRDVALRARRTLVLRNGALVHG